MRKTGPFSSKAAADNAKAWWKKRGYKVSKRKLSDGWYLYLTK